MAKPQTKKIILKGQCKSCLACKNNPDLTERFYKAWFEREPGGETLKMLGEELSISNQAIYRHANHHMHKRVNNVAEMKVKEAEAQKIKLEAMKELQISFDHDSAVPLQAHEKIIAQVLTDGLAQLRVKGVDYTVNQLLAAAKIQGDWVAKKRGQDTEILKMLHRSASGFNSNRT